MPGWKKDMSSLKRILRLGGMAAVATLCLGNAGTALADSCDSLYYLLQDLAVTHVRGNEIWIEHYLNCAPSSDTVGGFILSEVGEDGAKDRAIVAGYGGPRGWLYRFGERGRNIRFARPTPLIDVDGDAELDVVFTATPRNYATENELIIVFVRDHKRENQKLVPMERDMAVDSIYPAPEGSPHPLRIVDRRGMDIGGLSYDKAPKSYRYYVWDPKADPPSYVDRTANHVRSFPIMQERASFVKSLPASGDLVYETEAEYEEFLINIIGYSLDQSNIGRELKGFEEVNAILERVRYKGSTESLSAPRSVIVSLRRALPEAQKQQQLRNTGN